MGGEWWVEGREGWRGAFPWLFCEASTWYGVIPSNHKSLQWGFPSDEPLGRDFHIDITAISFSSSFQTKIYRTSSITSYPAAISTVSPGP